MADSYTKLYIQLVFTVKRRECLIHADWENELYKYITGIIKLKDQSLIAINGMPDHTHMFIRIKPTCALSDLVREVKKASTNFINENKFTKHTFSWQNGFGAFSYNERQVEMITNYIKGQKAHHAKKKFKDEYIGLLKEFKIDYKEEYLFDWVEVE